MLQYEMRRYWVPENVCRFFEFDQESTLPLHYTVVGTDASEDSILIRHHTQRNGCEVRKEATADRRRKLPQV
jgi:hypothetical protein